MTASTGPTDVLTRFLANSAVSTAGSGSSSKAGGSSGGNATSWVEAMGKAWGDNLDKQADKIITLSDNIRGGDDNPSDMAKLTAAAQRLSFTAQNAATSQNSAAEALNTISKRN